MRYFLREPFIRLRNLFFSGMLVILPIGATIWLVMFLLDFYNDIYFWFTDLLSKRMNFEISPKFEESWIPENAIGLVFIIAIISLIGFITQLYVGRKLLHLFELILSKIPIISNIYQALKQISETIMGRRSRIFEGVVILEYPRKGIYSLAFLTGKDKHIFENYVDEKLIYIFLPTTPNPTSGFFLIVPEESLIPVDLTVEEAMKMVVSSGMVTPPPFHISQRKSVGADHNKELPAVKVKKERTSA